ncbi:MAG: hypothetical protein LBJ67_05025 [Planctomycetaceae bacterium]|nr:hypothetical protein [Planctomycetaceae bacterium]
MIDVSKLTHLQAAVALLVERHGEEGVRVCELYNEINASQSSVKRNLAQLLKLKIISNKKTRDTSIYIVPSVSPVVPFSGKYIYKENKINKESKSIQTTFCFDESDKRYAEHLHYRKQLLGLIREKELSEDLVNRIAYGCTLKLPGFDVEHIQAVLGEATERKKQGIIKYKYIHVAKYAADWFKAAGYEWTRCRTPRECEIEKVTKGIPPKTKSVNNQIEGLGTKGT